MTSARVGTTIAISCSLGVTFKIIFAMKLEIARKNFLGIKNTPVRDAKVVMVPFGLEKTVSFGHGTASGPKHIIEISPNLEYFDEELETEIYRKVKICTLAEPKIRKEQKAAILQLEEIINEIYKLDKLPITLGGEHSLTLGPVRAALKRYKDISILHFDAHSDLRDSYEGGKYSHAAVMRRCFELGNINFVQIGIRNISNEDKDGCEFDFWRANHEKIKIFWAKDKNQWRFPEVLDDILKGLKENVYVSFDVDAFDSSLMPSTGTPEPGGLGWYETLDILRAVAKNKNIIGADFVELAPIKGLAAPDFLVAKLVYKTIGYKFCL